MAQMAAIRNFPSLASFTSFGRPETHCRIAASIPLSSRLVNYLLLS